MQPDRYGEAEDQAFQSAVSAGVVQESVAMVRELFRDQDATEFIIATIPTVLGINESARLLQALRRERIPCKRIIVNQARRCLVSWVTGSTASPLAQRP